MMTIKKQVSNTITHDKQGEAVRMSPKKHSSNIEGRGAVEEEAGLYEQFVRHSEVYANCL